MLELLVWAARHEATAAPLRLRGANGEESRGVLAETYRRWAAARPHAADSTFSESQRVPRSIQNPKEEINTMKMATYLNYNGKCADAFHYYEQHLGGKIGMIMTHGDAPQQTNIPPEWKDAVLHASITIAGSVLMGADIPNAQPMRSAYISLSVDSDNEAERIYAALSDGGEIFMPMQETFFASRFAQLRDKFGTSWMILHEKPMGPPQA